MSSADNIREIVAKNRRYLDEIEAADKAGRLPKINKIRKNFTLDEDIFLEFQSLCIRQGRPMSRVIEGLMGKYIKEGEIPVVRGKK